MPLRTRVPVRLSDPFAADDDRTLAQRFAETKDEVAFSGLVSRHARMVFGVCKRMIGDAHLAEDAFQAVFLVLARKPCQAVSASSVGGWLFGIARRVGLAARRHELRQQKHLAGTANANKKHEARAQDFDDLLCVLDEELAALPETYRAVLVACFLEERTQDEAAKQLGWSLSTVRRRLEQAKELLRGRLVRRGVTLAAGLFAGALAPSARAAVPAELLLAASTSARPSQLAIELASETIRGTALFKVVLAAIGAVAALGGLALGIDQRQSPDGSANDVKPKGSLPIARQDSHFENKKPWVTLSGRVEFPQQRDLPKLRPVPSEIIKDIDFFKPDGELFHRDVLVDPKTRGIANVMVWLRPDSDDRTAQFRAEEIHPALVHATPADRVIEVGREGFLPRVTAARVGDRIVFGNPTPIAFNVNYQHGSGDGSDVSGSFNILLPSGGTHLASALPTHRPMPDLVKDGIHPWISGYVRTFEHPYFAVTDEYGNFQIKDAPEGSWRLVLWHEKIGYKGLAAGQLGERISVVSQGRAACKLEPFVLNSDPWDGQQ